MSVSVLGREGPAASLFSAQKSGLSAPGRGVHPFLGGSESVDTGIWGSPTEKAGSLPGAPVAVAHLHIPPCATQGLSLLQAACARCTWRSVETRVQSFTIARASLRGRH